MYADCSCLKSYTSLPLAGVSMLFSCLKSRSDWKKTSTPPCSIHLTFCHFSSQGLQTTLQSQAIIYNFPWSLNSLDSLYKALYIRGRIFKKVGNRGLKIITFHRTLWCDTKTMALESERYAPRDANIDCVLGQIPFVFIKTLVSHE